MSLLRNYVALLICLVLLSLFSGAFYTSTISNPEISGIQHYLYLRQRDSSSQQNRKLQEIVRVGQPLENSSTVQSSTPQGQHRLNLNNGNTQDLEPPVNTKLQEQGGAEKEDGYRDEEHHEHKSNGQQEQKGDDDRTKNEQVQTIIENENHKQNQQREHNKQFEQIGASVKKGEITVQQQQQKESNSDQEHQNIPVHQNKEKDQIEPKYYYEQKDQNEPQDHNDKFSIEEQIRTAGQPLVTNKLHVNNSKEQTFTHEIEESNRIITKITIKPAVLTSTRLPALRNSKEITPEGTECSPKKNIVLLKTHKTGSSTIQNILYRYGDVHNLRFALPVRGSNYFGNPAYFNRKYVRTLKGHYYNILANHAKYEREAFRRLMPEDTKYVTILRHPATQFESLYSYYKFNQRFKVDLETFTEDPLLYYNKYEVPKTPVHSSLNPNLFDLGLRKKFLNDEHAIDEKILSLSEDFDLFLITEFLEESVILLRDIMCWSWEDIVFLSSNMRQEKNIVSKKMTDSIIQFNAGDWKLYQHFNKTLWKKIEVYGRRRMEIEKKNLIEQQQKLKEKCLLGTKTMKEMQNVKITRYVLKPAMTNDHLCTKITIKALDYLEQLNKKMGKYVDR